MLGYWTDIHRANYVYVPCRDDPTDRMLADYINKADHMRKAKCLFVREQSGVYSFFSKRVIMTSEHGKLSIRVGGGFMSIDEFIEINNPWEQSKKLMSQAAVIRASNQSVSQYCTPLRRDATRDLSPERTARTMNAVDQEMTEDFVMTRTN